MSAVMLAVRLRTRSRAFATVLTGCAIVPGLASSPFGATKRAPLVSAPPVPPLAEPAAPLRPDVPVSPPKPTPPPVVPPALPPPPPDPLAPRVPAPPVTLAPPAPVVPPAPVSPAVAVDPACPPPPPAAATLPEPLSEEHPSVKIRKSEEGNRRGTTFDQRAHLVPRRAAWKSSRRALQLVTHEVTLSTRW